MTLGINSKNTTMDTISARIESATPHADTLRVGDVLTNGAVNVTIDAIGQPDDAGIYTITAGGRTMTSAQMEMPLARGMYTIVK